jgi:hypothetical protein
MHKALASIPSTEKKKERKEKKKRTLGKILLNIA